MMNPTWPERILCGHTRGASCNARKTGVRDQEIREGFRPGAKDRQNGSCRPLCPRLHSGSADAAHAEPGYARVCCPAWLDRRHAGEGGRFRCITKATTGEVVGSGTAQGKSTWVWCGGWTAGEDQ